MVWTWALQAATWVLLVITLWQGQENRRRRDEALDLAEKALAASRTWERATNTCISILSAR